MNIKSDLFHVAARGKEQLNWWRTLCKSSPDSQPISQIMDAISKNDHPSNTGDVLWCRMQVGVCMTVAMVHHLML